jgi:hypothetical protein
MKNSGFIFLAFALMFLNSNVFSQSEEIKGRYIKFTNEEEIFIEKDGNIEIRDIILCNIMEGESSKPVHIAVNELSNVVKFGIKSKSGDFANQRQCFLIMNSQNYISTFRMVLHRMEVEYVFINGEYITTDKFYILNK